MASKKTDKKKTNVTWKSSNARYAELSGKQAPNKEYWSKVYQQRTRLNKALEKMKEEKEQRREIGRELGEEYTKGWKNEALKDQYNTGSTFKTYAEKQKIDSENIRKKQKYKSSDEMLANGDVYGYTYRGYKKYVGDKAFEENTAATKKMAQDNPYFAYAVKQMSDTPVSDEMKTKYGSETKAKQARLDDFLKTLGVKKVTEEDTKKLKNQQNAMKVKDQDVDMGSWFGGQTDEIKELFKTKNIREYQDTIEELKDKGYFDNRNDITLWTPEKRKEARASYVQQAKDYQQEMDDLSKQIEENPYTGNRWDYLLDLYSTPEIENERKIINGSGYTEAEKKAAQERLNMLLNKNTGIGSQSATDRAKNFYQYNEKNLNEYRDHMNMDSMRRMAYDAMNGNGAYDKAVSSMSAEDRAAMDERINNALDYVTDPEGILGVQRRTAQGNRDIAQDWIDKIDRQDVLDQKYSELMQKNPAGTDTAFHAENVTADINSNGFLKDIVSQRVNLSGSVDDIYALMNPDAYNEQSGTNLVGKEALMMNQDERDIFMSYYNAGKKNEARAFYDGLKPYLNQRYSAYESLDIKQTARRFPVMSTVVSEMANIAQPAEALANLPGQLYAWVSGTENAQTDPYSSAYIATRVKNGIRAAVSEDLEDWGWVYQGLMSGVDSYVNISLAQGMGIPQNAVLNLAGTKIPMVNAASLALFHTQAFETSLQNTMSQGNDPFGYDFVEAWIDAAIETATEIWSVENWLKEPTNLLRYVGKIAISEPSEEVVGAILEPYAKRLIGHRDQYQERAKQILADGGYTDGNGDWIEVKDMDAATRQAMREWNHDIRMAAQEALISVAPSIGRGAIHINTQNRNIGSTYNQQMEDGTTGARQLAEQAAQMAPGTDSQRKAQELLSKMDAGKKVSNYKVGQLVQDMMRESTKAENGREIQQKVSEIGQKAQQTRLENTVKNAMDIDSYMASEPEIENAKGTQTEGRRGVLYHDGGESTHATLERFEKGKAIINLNGQEKAITLNDKITNNLSAVDAGTAAVLYSVTTNNKLVSDGYANAMLSFLQNNDIAQPALFVAEAENLARDARTNKALGATAMPQKYAQFLYNLAKSEYIKYRENVTKDAQKTMRKPGEGIIKFKGQQFTTEEAWNKHVDAMNISQTEKEDLKLWGQIGRMIGYEVNFKTAEEMGSSEIYGAAQQGAPGIFVNIEGVDKNGERHSIGATFSHETIHYLEFNTRDGYENLKNYVIDQYVNKYGRSALYDRLNTIMQRDYINSYEEAISEFMADGLDDILTHKEVLQHLAETNKGLYEDIKTFVKDLITRVRNAITRIKQSGNVDARRIQAIQNQMTDLGKLFNLAMDEMWSGELQYNEEKYKQANEILQQAYDNRLTGKELQEAKTLLSRADAVMEKNGLIATHTLSFENMKKLMRLEGIPAASFAVAQTVDGMTTDFYGNMSFVVSQETIDPRKNASNYIYGRDAWTATFPQTKKGLFGERFVDNNQKVTAQGAVDLMSERNRKSGVFSNEFKDTETPDINNNYGLVHHIASELSKNYQSIEELQADRKRLGTKTTDEIRKALRSHESEMDSLKRDIIREIEATGRNISEMYEDRNQGEALEVLNAFRIVNDNYQEGIDRFGLSEQTVERIRNMTEALQNIPVRYAEAKPMRVIGWNEIRLAVIPADTPIYITDFFEEHYIPYEVYNTTEERADILKNSPSVDQLRFSRNDLGLEELTEGQKNAILEAKDIYIENMTDLLKVINEARTNNDHKKNIFLGRITENTKNNLEKEARKQLKGEEKNRRIFNKGDYIFGFNSDDIRHFDKHFENDTDIAYALFDAYKMLTVNDEVKPVFYNDGRTRLIIKYNTNVIEITSTTQLSNKKRAATTISVYVSMGKIKDWRALDRQAMLRNVHSSDRGATSNNNIPQNVNNSNMRLSRATAEERRYIQGRSASHIRTNQEARDLIYQKYGINENDIMFGIEFTDNGKVDYAAHDNDEKKLIRKISKQDLKTLWELQKDTEKWRNTWNEGQEIRTEDFWENADEIDRLKAQGVDPEIENLFGRKINPKEKYAAQVIRHGEAVAVDRDYYYSGWRDGELDKEYAAAVARGDLKQAEGMLIEKLARSQGIVAFRAPHGYAGSHQKIAQNIKQNYGDAVAKAVEDMAPYVPDNAILIPMPPSTGMVNDDTDTMILSKALAEATGAPVINALTSNERQSRYKAKQAGQHGPTAEEMGFRKKDSMDMQVYRAGQWYNLPDVNLNNALKGKIPVYVDNVVGSGETAKAATQVLGGGITLAYAKSTRGTPITGLKNLTVTYDENGDLIPLSKRLDINNPSVKYSRAQMDEKYMQAVKDGNKDLARKLVYEAGEKAGWSIKAYHGTARADRVGNVFLPERATSGPMAYFTDDWGIAENYSKSKNDTSIAYDEEYGDYFNQFRVNINGKNVPVGKLWNTLSFAERQKITERAKHITLDDEAENIIYDENAQYGAGNFTDYERKLHGWNSIDTLIEGWLNGGTLFNREQDFLDVLKLAGIENVTWNNPDARHEKVYSVLLNIQNPFVVSEMYNGKFLEGLENWWMYQDKAAYERETASADMWDKNSFSVDEWIAYGFDDVATGQTSNWTRIPDGVTDYLKSLGYDGIKDNGGKGGGKGHTVWIPFSSEQVKSAEPITYDDNGNVIPLSERFKKEKVDIRYSKANVTEDMKLSRMTEEDMDIHSFMLNATPSKFMTADEIILQNAYRTIRTNMELAQKRILEYREQMRKINSKAQLTQEDRDALVKIQNRMDIQQNKLARFEDELQKARSETGYAAMMFRDSQIIGNFITGKTQEQVQAAVDSLTNEVQQAEKDIAKQVKVLQEMENESAVKAVKRILNRSLQNRMVKNIISEYGTAMSADELKGRLAELILKSVNNEDILPDAQALAKDIIDNQTGFGNEDAMNRLAPYRGMTIEVSPEQMTELKGMNLTLKDIRQMTRGSGIKFTEGKVNTLDSNREEMIQQDAGLESVLTNDKSALTDFASYIQGLLNQRTGESAAGLIDQNDVEASILATVQIAQSEDAGGMAPADIQAAVAREAGRIGKALEAVKGVQSSVELMKQSGGKAQMWAGTLHDDLVEGIRYYNQVAKLAAEQERARVKSDVIDKLKSDNAKKLVQQQEQFREQLKKDKQMREAAQENMVLRRRINAVANRMMTRLFAETDLKNVPEETKPLVRQVLKMLNDHDMVYRRVTFNDRKMIDNITQRLQKMDQVYGTFDMDNDLNWLKVGEDTEMQERAMKLLADIESGLLEYRLAEGQKGVSLMDRKNALTKVQQAVSQIWNMVQSRSSAEIMGRKWQVLELAELFEEEAQKSRFKGERTGFGKNARNAATGLINYGNTTPEYFIKWLKNKAMDLLHDGLKDAENRNGLEAQKAMTRVAQIAKGTGFATWDGQKKIKIKTANGGTVEATTEQVMALYATWLREQNQLRPEETAHLLHGGFVLSGNEESKKPGRQKSEQRPIRMNKANLDMLGSYLTDEQKAWVDQIVGYMSGELAELGNEASMKMYGIKKFTEQYYFPIKSWGGVLNSRSDAGVNSNNENRAAQQGFSKRIRANANNAILISDFTPTAMKHIAGMINYNTVGPAIENINKVLNQQLEYGERTEEEDNTYKRNMRAGFQEYYGKQSYDYLLQFMKDMNGGVTMERTPFDKLLSIFKKNAVAGSLSVAAQQPLSYIRAAMMINPKYLAQAISPQYWKGSYQEMMDHSGIAVIKKMGKFDMNYGRTMQEYITPEGMESKARKAWNKFTDIITSGPEKMDAMTWTRMWTAVKLEQAAQNKGMDLKSDEFMEKVTERFNDLMRRTQVYDSAMVKSQNMRSNHWYMKSITSFMAEPTLSLNVLEDAWMSRKEKGGKAKIAKALATFMLSAAAQAGAKAFFGTGRSPDKKKNREENFMNKFWYNFFSEANPLGLIPGFSQIVEALTEGELNDNAMGVVSKFKEVYDNTLKLVTGKESGYRALEDSVGQLVQMISNVPAKNLMRDFRAMVNFFSNGTAYEFTGNGYAQRETSDAVLEYQFWDTFFNNNMGKLVNSMLGDAGYKTDNNAYYQRIYEAEKAGNTQAASKMKEYMLKVKLNGEDPEKTLNNNLRKLVKADDDLSSEEKYKQQKELGLQQGTSYIKEQYQLGNLTRKEAEKLLKEENPKLTDKELLKALDKIDWEKSGKDGEDYTNYTPLMAAIENNKVDEIRKAAEYMLKNGYEAKDIKEEINKRIKKQYLAATSESEKTKLYDALTKTYKVLGYTAEDAKKTLEKWIKEKKKNSSAIGFIASGGAISDSGNMSRDTTGRYGRGNIDLNNRKVVQNEDGSISTEIAFSINVDGKEVLIPQVVDGKIVSEDEAIEHYFETGEYLGIFDTVEEANEYAEKLHNRQDWYYHR